MRHTVEFPKQRISGDKKDMVWTANCVDYVISQGLAQREQNDVEEKFEILRGNISEEFYRKIINPYNATNEKYKRFPATLRHYDLIKGVVRRYTGEYIKNPHSFIVSANNPEVIIGRDAKLRQELNKLIEAKIAAKMEAAYADFINGGGNPQEFNPSDVVDVEKFSKEFIENYVDEISAQGQHLLDIIRDITDDTLLYAQVYGNYVSFGEGYTYTDIDGKKLIKRSISPRDAFPINSDNIFREDDDMFACRRYMTYQQIIDEFDNYLDDKQRSFLERHYDSTYSGYSRYFNFASYQNYFPDICKKFKNEDINLFRQQPIMMRDLNNNNYEVWHVVWRGETRVGILTYVNESGFIDTKEVSEDYEFNKENGDIDIEYVYIPQVYEAVRIGGMYDAIYPYKARAVVFDRNGKLPYNGVNEIMPGMGKFSIIEIMTPYQIFYNIVSYHREMILAKNKLSVLMMAKSLLGKKPEDTIYKMLADNVLYVDDSDDMGGIKMQQVRMLNASMGDYIQQLTMLLESIKVAANEQVDMTAQRYGSIADNAGKGVTEEAVVRGSMGSVILEFMINYMRERDYARDMDYTKLAWIDGLNASYKDETDEIRHLSLNVNNHIYADYAIKAKNSTLEREKLIQLKQFAFNMGQNGNTKMAIAAIAGDNVASIKKLIYQFDEELQARQEQIQQLEQQTEQMRQEFEMRKIELEGENKLKAIELEGYIDKEIELIRADANMISYNAEVGDTAKREGIDRLNAARIEQEKDRNNIARQKNILDAFDKYENRRIKEKEIDTKLEIAKTNKNRFDVNRKHKR